MKALLLTLVLLVAPVAAQEIAAPALDAIDRKLVAGLQEAASLANVACNALPEVKHYQSMRTTVGETIEARHPGFTFDAAKGSLAAKAKK